MAIRAQKPISRKGKFMYGQWFVVPTLGNYVKQSITINGVLQRMNCISNTFELYTRGLGYTYSCKLCIHTVT